MFVEVGCVDTSGAPCRLGVVPHRVVTVVCDSLVAAQARVGPGQQDGGR